MLELVEVATAGDPDQPEPSAVRGHLQPSLPRRCVLSRTEPFPAELAQDDQFLVS